MSTVLPIQRLEQYTFRFPDEVLMVNAQVNGEDDFVVVFRGFSSSLVNPTAADPEVPVLSAEAAIETIDRLQGPYTPENPQFLERDIPWREFSDRLTQLGL